MFWGGTPPCGAAAKTAELPPLPRVPGGVPHSCRHMQGPQARVSEPVALAGRPPCSSQGRELSVFGPGHVALATQLLSGEKPGHRCSRTHTPPLSWRLWASRGANQLPYETLTLGRGSQAWEGRPGLPV